MKVKIIKCEDSRAWYYEAVGSIREVYTHNQWSYYVPPIWNTSGWKRYCVRAEDCEVVKEPPVFDLKTSPWWIHTPTPEISEQVQLWLFDQGLTWYSGEATIKSYGRTGLTNVGVDGRLLKGFVAIDNLPKNSKQELKITFKTIVDEIIYPPVETEEQIQLTNVMKKIAELNEQADKLKSIMGNK